MGSGIFGIGLTGLHAAQAGLATAGHNIANVNTPGYSRQVALQTASRPLYTGDGYFGQGVDLQSVRRIYGDFLVLQSRTSLSELSSLTTSSTELRGLDDLFADPTAGLSPVLDEYFAGLNGVAAHASDTPSRVAALGAARALASRFATIDGELVASRRSINGRIDTIVASINGDATEIGELNRQIALASADASTPPNDLLDRRDAAAARLAESIGIRTAIQDDGSMNVYLSSGQGLVVGDEAAGLSVRASRASPADREIGLSVGGFAPLRASDLTGGSLGGLVAFRDGALTDAQNAFGRLATTVALSMNAQHRLGLDQNGNPGGDLFSLPASTVRAWSGNTGNGALAVTIGDAGALVASDYDLRYDGAGFTLTRLSDGTASTFASLPQTVDGFQIAQVSGAMVAGDRYRIEPVRAAAGGLAVALTDPARLAAASPVIGASAGANRGGATLAAIANDASYWSTPLAAPMTLSFASGTATLSGFPAVAVSVTVGGVTTPYPPAAPVPWTDGAKVSFGGLSFTMSGTPANGDSFTLSPNVAGVGDNRNMQRLAALASANLVAGRASFAGAYGELVAGIGQAAHAADSERAAQSAVQTRIDTARDSISGVNLDAEAAALQRYQQAYQASAKVIQVAASLFETILAIGRG